MLDLKAKLLQAGLVTEDQVSKVEKEQRDAAEKRRVRAARRRQGRRAKGTGKGSAGSGHDARSGDGDEAERWRRRVARLAEAGKAEQYETIRAWVKKTRLDDEGARIAEDAERFHFSKLSHVEGEASIGWLTIGPDVKQKLADGQAGLVAYMSNNGLMHCVVPRDVAIDIHRVRPEWLRALHGYDFEPVAYMPKKVRTKKAGGGVAPDTRVSSDTIGRADAQGESDRAVAVPQAAAPSMQVEAKGADEQST